jgi:hypothetical protein
MSMHSRRYCTVLFMHSIKYCTCKMPALVSLSFFSDSLKPMVSTRISSRSLCAATLVDCSSLNSLRSLHVGHISLLEVSHARVTVIDRCLSSHS